MSKASRKRRKAKRDAEKNRRKARKKALYQQYAVEGRSKHSKRRVLNNQRTRKLKEKRHTSVCGNLGCQRCYATAREARRATRGKTTLSFKAFMRSL